GGPRLGGGDNAGGNFSIDDVLIYNRVLSAAEITTLATTVPEPSAVLLGGLSLAGLLVRRRRA
ncbi:MAG: PEP-CTERM sorting domain-containing protein, partial [Verrucomicrobiaceae bacterium]